jgi:hypothetical protein
MRLLAALILFASAPVLAPSATIWAGLPPPSDGSGQPREAMSRRSAPFEANLGQFGPGVDFVQRGADHALLLSPTAVVFQPVRRRDAGAGTSAASAVRPLRLRFEGAAAGAVAAGRTTSPDFPASGGLANDLDTQTFVAKLDPTGETLLWATYLGGEAEDVAFGIAVDAAGAAHVVGKTQSSDFPTTANAFQPSCAGSGFSPESCVAAFLAKLSPDGDALAYSTFLFGAFNADSGTAGFDEAQGVGLDPAGAVYVAGSTASKHFPVTAGALQTEFAGVRDGFVVKIDPALSGRESLRYATYLGGSFDPGAGSYGGDTP